MADQLFFSRTQRALQTPFDPLRNPGFGGVPSPLTSQESQSAIEESLTKAIGNDRILVFSFLNGNAGNGKYLEIYSGIDMFDAPLVATTTLRAKNINARTTSANATCTLGFYDLVPVTPTLLYTLTFTAQKEVSVTGAPDLFVLSIGMKLAIKVDSGSINKPHLQLAFNTEV
jgi:hypothetical protein